MFGRSFWFHVTMIPFVAVAGLASAFMSVDEGIMCAYLGLSAAITSRFWFREILEWKSLAMMIVIALVVIAVMPKGHELRLLSEFVFWWGICGIPMRVRLCQIDGGHQL